MFETKRVGDISTRYRKYSIWIIRSQFLKLFE
jgi:hypothetical protein